MESEHAQASTQGNLDNLSARSRAKFMGLPVPEVQGVNHQRSAPYTARMEARLRMYQYRTRHRTAWQEHQSGQNWTHEDLEQDREELLECRLAWDHAEKISRDSGFEFFDRHDKRCNVGAKTFIVAEIVDQFLSQHGGQFKHIKS